MSIGESYNEPPRVSSTYRRTIFRELEKIANNVDFRHPRFTQKHKRTRSLGSAQALIVEIALTDERVANTMEGILRSMMVDGGKDWVRTITYLDKY